MDLATTVPKSRPLGLLEQTPQVLRQTTLRTERVLSQNPVRSISSQSRSGRRLMQPGLQGTSLLRVRRLQRQLRSKYTVTVVRRTLPRQRC